MHRCTPELIAAALPARHHVGDRWFVDETYVKVAGVWRYVYRAVDRHGQVIDVFVSRRRDVSSARRFFHLDQSGPARKPTFPDEAKVPPRDRGKSSPASPATKDRGAKRRCRGHAEGGQGGATGLR